MPNRSSIVKYYFSYPLKHRVVYFPLVERKRMTVCVATLCDQGKGIVLVSDKMVGIGYVEAELENTKVQPLHSQWFMMMSGQNISPLFELGDLIRAEMPMPKPAPLESVMEITQRNYELIRVRRAEAEYLKPIGWTIKRFNEEGSKLLPNFLELQSKLQDYELSVEILVAGFDPTLSPPAKIFTLASSDRGIPVRHDLPGFAAIGSGGIAAAYMLYFRDVKPSLPVRAAVYYALEAKYFGEHATGVGPSTDMFVIHFDGTLVRVIQINDEKTIEKKLIPICERLEPPDPTQGDVDILNDLPELNGFPTLPKVKIKRKKQPADK
jgi:20S proteasome alpha/beta subunit